MEPQRRWLCKSCKREWVEPTAFFANSYPVSITGNPKGLLNCPICGSPDTHLYEYKPSLPGLDLPRNEMERCKEVTVEVISKGIRIKTLNNLGERKAEDLIVTNKKLMAEVKRNETINLVHDIKADEINKVDSVYDLSDMD